MREKCRVGDEQGIGQDESSSMCLRCGGRQTRKSSGKSGEDKFKEVKSGEQLGCG